MAGSVLIENLEVRRGDFSLSIDQLHIEEREVFAILGPTGSGKTVLMEAIAGAFPIEQGRILLDEKDVETLPIQQRHLGVVYQDYALFPHYTVFENIAYGLRMNGFRARDIQARVHEMLQLFSIEHIADSYPGVISGGEGQRTALARALILQPEILLLDEPFSALDPATKKRMYDLVRNVHSRFDCTIVFVTHDFNEAEVLADRIGIVLAGRIGAITSPEGLRTEVFEPEIAHFLGREE